MHQEGPFNERWSYGSIQPGETEALAKQLQKEGAREYTQEAASEMTAKALSALERARPEGEAAHALAKLADRLLRRDV